MAAAPGSAAAATPTDLTALVNPLIGTQQQGNTFPGAALPFGMVQLSPDTGYNTGYDYDQKKIWGFSHTHLSGVGCSAGTEVPMMPTVGAVTSNDPTVYGQPLDHSAEKSSPGFYQLGMPNGVTAELTATARTGWHRYTFPAGTQSNVLFNISEVRGDRSNASTSALSIVGSDTVEGSVSVEGFCSDSPPRTVYFSARFSRPFASFGTWSGSTFSTGSRSAGGSGAIGGWVRFDTSTEKAVTAKVGLSYTGTAGARSNLAAETDLAGFDFDSVRTAARDTWNHELHSIEVDGGDPDRQVPFYTSLYHSLLHPNLAGDVDGQYRGFDNAVHTAQGYTPYQNFSLWDTYRAQNQLVALLEPKVARDSALSLLAVQREGGWLPRWSLVNTETNTMTGDPITPFLVDIWSRGLLDGHEEEFYTALRANALGTPPPSGTINGRNGNPYYGALGYVPTGVSCTPTHQFDNDCQYPASATLEYAVADSALAIMARALGHDADADLLDTRGQNYRALFDTQTKFFRPRDADGNWMNPYDPVDGGHKFHEAGAYQYQWLVPQDPAGLIDLLGGTQAATSRLDDFFAYPALLTDPSGTARTKWVNGAYDYYSFKTYNPNNEPDLLAPFAYLWAGHPDRTATVLRAAFTLFRNSPDGVTGNDDLGTMSAWYVLSSLGVYPLMNGSNTYGLSSPQFPTTRVTVGAYGDQQGGTLTLNAPGVSDTNRYITAVSRNGDAISKNWVSHEGIAHGGRFDFTVASEPGTWGTGADAVPPSVNRATPAPATTDLALGKPATGSAPCAATEGPAQAVNGTVTKGNTDKFCSSAANPWLQIDLGTAQPVSEVDLAHAAAGGEQTGYNTKAYAIRLSTDGTTWTTPVTVTDNVQGITTHPFPVTTARYVRLDVSTPSQISTDLATRIYELKVSGPANLALGKAATGSAACAASEGPEKAVNGSVTGGNSDKFCSGATDRWLRVDLGAVKSVSRFLIKHAEAGGEQAGYNTRDFRISVSTDGDTWTTPVTVNGNTAAVTTSTITPVKARYARLEVVTPTQFDDQAARIYEFEVYAG